MSAQMTPQEIAAYLAEREAAITAQRLVVDRLDELVDDERRHLRDLMAQQANLRALLAERGELP